MGLKNGLRLQGKLQKLAIQHNAIATEHRHEISKFGLE